MDWELCFATRTRVFSSMRMDSILWKLGMRLVFFFFLRSVASFVKWYLLNDTIMVSLRVPLGDAIG